MTITLTALFFIYPSALLLMVLLLWLNQERKLQSRLESKRKKIYCRSCGALNKVDMPRIQFRCKTCGAKHLVEEKTNY
jgi:predicted RNA-binding Zn-ribbon protein involved in translation (DUF1610 family)